MSDEDRETKPFKFVTGELKLLQYTDGLILFRLSPKILLLMMGKAGFDARFPNQNQTKHCWQNYVDYHKCILAKGEDFAPCRQVHRNLLLREIRLLNCE